MNWLDFIGFLGCKWWKMAVVGYVRENVWVWVGAAWMLPCRGPMPGGDVICGGARARLESRDSRLGAGSEPAELALLLGSNRARVESRD